MLWEGGVWGDREELRKIYDCLDGVTCVALVRLFTMWICVSRSKQIFTFLTNFAFVIWNSFS